MKKTKGFTLIELLVVIAIIALLISILLPSLARAREVSKQTACTANVKGIGNACYSYQEDNANVFPTAPHRIDSAQTDPIVDYIGSMGSLAVADRMAPTGNEDITGKKVSISRNLWILVRSGGVIPKNVICPSSEDTTDPTVDVLQYYDFVGFGVLSYGYQVPTDPKNPAKPSADADPRMALIADKGPWSARAGSPIPSTQYYNDRINPAATAMDTKIGSDPDGSGPETFLKASSSPEYWKLFNSPNHGGAGKGEGQSVLYPDIHAEFLSKPTAGVDGDNIYTKIDFNRGTAADFFKATNWGAPWGTASNGLSRYPGWDALGTDIHSSTDSLLWP